MKRLSIVLAILLLSAGIVCATEALDDFRKQEGKALPKIRSVVPTPPVPLPEGSVDLSFDRHGNFWALSAPEKGKCSVILLKAQDQGAWVEDDSPGLNQRARWSKLIVDDRDCIWVTDGKALLRNDPKQALWVNASAQRPQAGALGEYGE
ncbi:MAG: hypothetical protein ACYTGH_13095 [Planctomycetota bacterium]|jgi:streptogramin lyase